MRTRLDLPDENQLMLRLVEAAHLAIGLVPDTEVFRLGKHPILGGQHLAHVAPVHEDEGDGCSPRARRSGKQGRGQKLRKLGGGQFARGKGELPMLHRPKTGNVPDDWDIVGRVGEDEIDILAIN